MKEKKRKKREKERGSWQTIVTDAPQEMTNRKIPNAYLYTRIVRVQTTSSVQLSYIQVNCVHFEDILLYQSLFLHCSADLCPHHNIPSCRRYKTWNTANPGGCQNAIL